MQANSPKTNYFHVEVFIMGLPWDEALAQALAQAPHLSFFEASSRLTTQNAHLDANLH